MIFRRLILVAAGACLLSGCGGGLVNLERSKGQIELHRPDTKEKPPVVSFDPVTASLSKSSIDVTVRYAPPEDLDRFFGNKEVFGNVAGKNPYPPRTLVFYVKVFNHSGKKIKVDPENFVMIDNLNIQFSELSADNISAIYESKAGAWTFAKSTGDLAPGPYGAPFKVAGALGVGSNRKAHYLIKQVRLASGYVYPGIAYDGYVAFPYPHPNATSVRLIFSDIKTDFNPADFAETAIDFEFPFNFKISKP